jgi:hypothetical protein
MDLGLLPTLLRPSSSMVLPVTSMLITPHHMCTFSSWSLWLC